MGDNRRIAWIDAWKGLLILLVVLGHVVGAMYHYADGTSRMALGVVYRAIYLFHMPAFFFVAGYLWRRHEDRSFAICFRDRARRLVVPYLFWGVVSALVFVAMIELGGLWIHGNDGYYGARMFDIPLWRPFVSILHAGDWPNGEGFRYNSVLWFLPCMFTVLLTYDGLDCVLKKIYKSNSEAIFNITLIAACTILAALMRFNKLNYWPWGLSRVPFFLIFFSTGRLLRDAPIHGRIAVKRWMLMCGWFFLFVVAWYYPDLWYGYTTWRWYAYSVAAALYGSLLTLWTAKAVADMWYGKRLSVFGFSSIGIMLLHKFLLMPLQMMYQRLSVGSLALLVIEALAITELVAVIAEQFSRIIQRIVPWAFGEREKSE